MFYIKLDQRNDRCHIILTLIGALMSYTHTEVYTVMYLSICLPCMRSIYSIFLFHLSPDPAAHLRAITGESFHYHHEDMWRWRSSRQDCLFYHPQSDRIQWITVNHSIRESCMGVSKAIYHGKCFFFNKKNSILNSKCAVILTVQGLWRHNRERVNRWQPFIRHCFFCI